ncbi:MAG: hypothetical protein JW936_00260 [Sedimentisphaerales bacterium]|nr:hypothetical protein [Sedimentisphaerales bacterium]
MSKAQRKTFKRYGRSYHLCIETADDLENVLDLDEALWVATNAPTKTINCDQTFLSLLDHDKNGRITCRDMKEAIRWLLAALADHNAITNKSTTLQLAAINTDFYEGQKIHGAAEKILARLSQSNTGQVTLEQVRKIKTEVESVPVSEAGVVLPQATEDSRIQQFLSDIIAVTGGTPHPSGAKGVASAQLDQFLADASAYINWYEQAAIPPGTEKTDIMPLGKETAPAYAILESVRHKIDQYFAQCEAAALDEQFVQRMGWTESELQNIDFDDPEVIEEVLQKAPLAKADKRRLLTFDDQVNPYYVENLETFRQTVASPVLGNCAETLSAVQWTEIRAFFAAHHDWVQRKAGSAAQPLGIEKLKTYLDHQFAQAVRNLIAESDKTAFVLDNIRSLERLILYQAHIIDLANNFVSAPHLYDPNSRAMFEMGTLIMDGRKFNLAVRVEDRSQHIAVAQTSSMFVIYAEVTPAQPGQAYEVAAPVTSGGKGNLCTGKRGIFCDIQGNECDAKIVHIIENPISYREALVSPFKRVGKLLTGKIESITASAEQTLDAQVSTIPSQIPPVSAPVPQPQAQSPRIFTGGLLMGGGVAVAALGSAGAYITKTLAGVPKLNIFLGILAAVLLVLLPISIVAFLKLRRRDLSAILEGSGWGINSRMRLTFKQGRSFTQKPKYPQGSKGVRSGVWRLILFVLLIIALLICGHYLHKHLADTTPQSAPSTGINITASSTSTSC